MEREVIPTLMCPNEMACGKMTAKCLLGEVAGTALKALLATGGEDRKVRDFIVFGCLSAHFCLSVTCQCN